MVYLKNTWLEERRKLVGVIRLQRIKQIVGKIKLQGRRKLVVEIRLQLVGEDSIHNSV